MIGQLVEEWGVGVIVMLRDGLFIKFLRLDYNFVWYVNFVFELGRVGYVLEWFYVNVDFVDVRVKGIGGYGVYLYIMKDLIVIGVQIVFVLQIIVLWEILVQILVVVIVGVFYVGVKYNVILDEVYF